LEGEGGRPVAGSGRKTLLHLSVLHKKEGPYNGAKGEMVEKKKKEKGHI